MDVGKKERSMTWREFEVYCQFLAEKIEKSKIDFDSIYGIPKGGCFVALKLSTLLSKPLVDSPLKHSLIVDDIVDSGRTISKFTDSPTATLFIKPHSEKKPDFFIEETKEWIHFPWEEKEETIEDNITRILEYIGEDPNREGLQRTPKRMVKLYGQIFSGYKEPMPELKTFTTSNDTMVVKSDIPFVTWCEHHMMPIDAKAYFAYIPNGRVVGIDKIIKLIEWAGNRLVIQENLTKEIVDIFDKEVKPLGVYLVIKATHWCEIAKDTKKRTITTTAALKGSFKQQKIREEALKLMGV